MVLNAAGIALMLQYATSFNAVGKNTNKLGPLARASDFATWGNVDKYSLMQMRLEYDQLGRSSEYEAPGDDGHHQEKIVRAHPQHGQRASKAVPVEKVAVEADNSTRSAVHIEWIPTTEATKASNNSSRSNNSGPDTFQENSSARWDNMSGSTSSRSDTLEENSSAPDTQWDNSLGSNSFGSDTPRENSSAPDTGWDNSSGSNIFGSDTIRENSSGPDAQKDNSSVLHTHWDHSTGSNNSASDTHQEKSSTPDTQKGNTSRWSHKQNKSGAEPTSENTSSSLPDSHKVVSSSDARIYKDVHLKISAEVGSYDVDGNGVITEDELYKGLKRIDPLRFNYHRMKELLKRLDTNADGELQYEEFGRWILGRWQRGKRTNSGVDRTVHAHKRKKFMREQDN